VSGPVDHESKVRALLLSMGDAVHAIDLENRELRREVKAIAEQNGAMCDDLWEKDQEIARLKKELEERDGKIAELQQMAFRRVG